MSEDKPRPAIKRGFEEDGVRIAIADILPLRLIRRKMKSGPKYEKIAASIREIGLVEPPVVTRNRGTSGKYLLLDGHVRIEILKDMGVTEVACIVSIDDEAFTYNKHVSRIATVQEHLMIQRAIKRGVPKERLAKALNVNVGSIRMKEHLLKDICPEAVEILKDRFVAVSVFRELRKMVPLRQIEAAQLMAAAGKFSHPYAKALLAATPKAQLAEPSKPKRINWLSARRIALMEHEAARLEREFKIVERNFGADHLDLVLTKAYLATLLSNARIIRYLGQRYPTLLPEFARIADAKVWASSRPPG